MLKFSQTINSGSGALDEVTTLVPAGCEGEYDVTAVCIVREITPETGSPGTAIAQLRVGEHAAPSGSWVNLTTQRSWGNEALDRLDQSLSAAPTVTDCNNKFRMRVHG